MNWAKTFVDRLRGEIADPLSHGSPIEGSVIRLVVLLAVAVYSMSMLSFGLVDDPEQRESARRIVSDYLPTLIVLSPTEN
jgi:hypothetical protein